MKDYLHALFPSFPEQFPLPMVLDGSTGTSLMREGMPAGACTETWVLEHPDVIKKIQSDYLKAGSDAVYSPTFGGNRPTLERNRVKEPVGINRRLAMLSCGEHRLVGGDLSPTGLFIKPFGDTPFDDIVAIYREQAKELEQAGVDFFISETNINLQEARAAVIGIREVSSKPIFVTMTVNENGHTLSGDTLLASFLALSDLGISAFGANCSQGPEKMLSLLGELVPYSLALGIPLIAKPNAGLPKGENGVSHFDLSAEDFGKTIPDFLDAGIFILGGCCGTDADYIREIRRAVNAFDSRSFKKTALPTKYLASGNRLVCEVNPAELSSDCFITPRRDFFDVATDKMFRGAKFFAIQFPDLNAAQAFLDSIQVVRLPCVVRGSFRAIEKVKHYYNGHLLILS